MVACAGGVWRCRKAGPRHPWPQRGGRARGSCGGHGCTSSRTELQARAAEGGRRRWRRNRARELEERRDGAKEAKQASRQGRREPAGTRARCGRSIGEGRREGSAPLSPCEWRRQEENEGEKGSRGGGFEREEGDGIGHCGGAGGSRGREAGLAFGARVRSGARLGLGGPREAGGGALAHAGELEKKPGWPAGFSSPSLFKTLPKTEKQRKKGREKK